MTAEPWRVELSARAQRDLARLPSRVAIAVVEFITAVLIENPERLSKPLAAPLDRLRSARRGDYRVLFELHESDRIVLVVRVAHRAHAYRPER